MIRNFFYFQYSDQNLQVVNASVNAAFENLSGYNPCQVINNFNTVGAMYTSGNKRSMCFYSRVYRLWTKQLPSLQSTSNFFGPYFNALYGRCYPCLFLANRLQSSDEKKKVTDCLKVNVSSKVFDMPSLETVTRIFLSFSVSFCISSILKKVRRW